MAAEARALRPGGEKVIPRLADILVIQAIRSWIARDPAAQTGWLGALRDPQIGRAIALAHRDPARNWTVASLATAVGMSRSAFAAA
jgi:transcriptional regulator GlxA family with amidase domain